MDVEVTKITPEVLRYIFELLPPTDQTPRQLRFIWHRCTEYFISKRTLSRAIHMLCERGYAVKGLLELERPPHSPSWVKAFRRAVDTYDHPVTVVRNHWPCLKVTKKLTRLVQDEERIRVATQRVVDDLDEC